jgi:RNase H-fold protein (predicted Holliday junction resolvase)
MEAENILISSDTSRSKRKKVIDAYAASIILDTYIRNKEVFK